MKKLSVKPLNQSNFLLTKVIDWHCHDQLTCTSKIFILRALYDVTIFAKYHLDILYKLT